MYRPSAFREDRPDILHAAIRAHPLATLVTQGAAGLTANLVPFILKREDGRDVLQAHMARTNEQFVDLQAGAEALVIFHGPHAYVTPSWYPSKHEHGKAVPTWNYVVVQARGKPRVIDDAEWLLAQIHDLTLLQEADRDIPWSVSDAPADFIAGLVKAIRGLEIPIERIEGKWKASQNQPAVNRAGVIAGLRDLDPFSAMAGIMDQQP